MNLESFFNFFYDCVVEETQLSSLNAYAEEKINK